MKHRQMWRSQPFHRTNRKLAPDLFAANSVTNDDAFMEMICFIDKESLRLRSNTKERVEVLIDIATTVNRMKCH